MGSRILPLICRLKAAVFGRMQDNMEDLTRYARAYGLRKINLQDDVIDSSVTAHALRNIIVNGLRRANADKGYVVEDREVREVDPKDAMKMDPDVYTLYDFGMKTDGTCYTIQIPMITDIRAFDAEVTISAPYEKPYANLTGLRPDFCVKAFDKIDGKPVWLNFPYELEKEDITDEELLFERRDVARVLLGESAA